MSSAKILRIRNFVNVGITAKSMKILLQENFTLYGILLWLEGWLYMGQKKITIQMVIMRTFM